LRKAVYASIEIEPWRAIKRQELNMPTEEALLEARRQHQQAGLPDPDECPHCGATGGKPIAIEDRDDSVGYHDIVQGCTLCIHRKAA